MGNRAYYEPIIKHKIDNIPDLLLPELMDMIDLFQKISEHQLTNNNEKTRKNKLLELLGSWSDFEEVDVFIDEIYDQRKQFFSGRNYQ